MTILKLGELFCMLCWMVHGRMRIKKEAWFGVKGMANLYITVCLRKQSMNFFEVSKNEYKAANSNDARKLRGLLVARSVVLVFLQKKGTNFRSSTPKLWKCNDICSTAHQKHGIYNNLYTALREGDTVQAQWPQKIVVVPFSQLDES